MGLMNPSLDEGSQSVPPSAGAELSKRYYPQTEAQAQLYMIDQMGEAGDLYTLPLALLLRGPLDQHALEAALDELIGRHAALRTTLTMIGDYPVQRVADDVQVELEMADAADLSTAREQARELLGRTFDLEQGPLLRALLIAYGNSEHLLMLTLHHTMGDGASLAVMADELGALYSAACGVTAALAPAATQYPDYTLWQRASEREQPWQRSLDFWAEELAGMPEKLALRTDHPWPERELHRGHATHDEIDGAVADRLERLARARSLTPAAPFLSLYGVLLQALSGQSDFGVGIPTDLRARPELDRMVGYCGNFVVVRFQLEPETTFAALLDATAARLRAALAHREVSFAAVVSRLAPKRTLSQSPLVQALFGYTERRLAPPSFAGLAVEELADLHWGIAKFSVNLNLERRSERLATQLSADAALYEADSVERMSKRYLRLCERAAVHPDATVAELIAEEG